MKRLKVFLSILIIVILGCVSIFFIYREILNKKANDSYYFHKHKAREFLKEGLFYDALISSDKAILKEKDNPNAYFLKIKALLKLKNFDEIENCINEAKSLCKQDFEIKKITKLENLVQKEKKIFEKYIKEHDNAKLIKPYLNSISKHKVKIKDNDIFYNDFGVRGVKATKKINSGKVIVEIPRDMLILSSEAKKFICEKYSKENKKDIKEIEKIIDQCYKKNTFSLGLFLLENKNNEKFKEYLNIIFSNDYSSFPITFNEKTIALLDNTSLENNIYNLKKDLDHDLDLLYKIDSVKKYDKQTLINIYSAVSSRNFGWDFNGKNEMLLVTYIDLVNNGKNKNSNWYFDSKKNSFCLKTIKNIKENEEIFDEYGSLKSNSRLLLNYGFTLPENSDNSECVIDINEIPFVCRKNVDKNDKNNNILDALKYLRKKNNTEGNNLSKIEKEKTIMNILQSICAKKKSNFNTTLDEDKKFLKDNSSKMSFNEINCYRVRIEEKEVLDWILKFIEECIDVLSKHTTTENLVKFIKEGKNIDKSVKEYLSDVFV